MSKAPFQRIHLDENGQVVVDLTTPAPVDPSTAESYPLAMPRNCMYGRAGEWADLIKGPDGGAYTSIIAVAASNEIRCSLPMTVPRVYVAHLGGIRVGKSTCIDRAVAIVPKKGNIMPQFPASLPGLAKMLHPGSGKDDPQINDPGYKAPTVTFTLDELEPLLKACATPGSGVALDGALRTLWTKQESGSADKKANHRVKAKINIVGPLPVATPQDFSKMFGAGTRGGLHDRFIFSVFPERWKWDHIRWQAPIVDDWCNLELITDPDALDASASASFSTARDARPAPFSKTIQVYDFVADMLDTWVEAAPCSLFVPSKKLDRSRLGEQAMRVAVITAACNGDSEITRECMEAALRFAEWQERIRKVYQPAESDDKFDQFVAEVEAALRAEQKSKPESYFVRWRDLALKHHWYRTYSRAITPMKKMLIQEELLLVHTTVEKDEDGKKKVIRDEALVRWHEGK